LNCLFRSKRWHYFEIIVIRLVETSVMEAKFHRKSISLQYTPEGGKKIVFPRSVFPNLYTYYTIISYIHPWPVSENSKSYTICGTYLFLYCKRLLIRSIKLCTSTGSLPTEKIPMGIPNQRGIVKLISRTVKIMR